ncbi:MAG: glycine zipper family protein [Rhodospirillales bacterium]|nr:glycine zipper family protein [Rhodospirillales bacterium]MDH3790616.1 glycine zipper family protein [Rhodospirillales bacterium]MDH3919250.1 glycine zipper family protein [Rhodospirillales bacterium]MDH3968234.1 glycine zipper family protein [Rhodospirillales bacterium]
MLLRCNRVSYRAALLAAGVLAGCASQQPALYPNAHYRTVGAAAAEADIEACISLAEAHGNTADQSGKVATNTAVGAGVGAAGGAAVGAVLGNAGRGAAAGAAGGAVTGLIRGLAKASEPEPIFKRFVEQCLAERGYQTIGWK